MKKKTDLKKLALMGITGGVMLASSASASQPINSENINQLLAAGCGGRSGCSSIAYQPHGCGGQSSTTRQSHGCGGQAPIAYQPHGCGGQSPVAYQPHGCQSAPQYANPGWNQQPSHSCNAQTQPSHGCNSHGCATKSAPVTPNDQGQIQPQNGNIPKPNQPINQPLNQPLNPQQQSTRGYSQWESNGQTADLGKNSSSRGQATLESIPGESDLLSQLNEEGKAVYRGLDRSGKEAAIKLASQTTSPGPFRDKNEAVKVAAQRLAEQRAKTNSKY